VLELGAATRQLRRDIQPRGHRGGTYPFLRAAMCVVLRDLIAFSVVSDVLRGRPAVYATFSSYDEVAHHSGLERHDTLEALRKVDKQIGRIARACRYAPRPYEIVVLSDHGQTQGATFKQRNGYGLDELVRRSVGGARPVQTLLGGDENETAVGLAFEEARGSGDGPVIGRGGDDVVEHAVVVLGSGNLGLIYLMEESRRLTLEEIEARHPQLVATLRGHPHVGFVVAHSAEHGPVALGARGAHYLRSSLVEGDDPLGSFSTNAARHLTRSNGFEHAPDLFVNSFYDAQVDEGCAFEELISFHGGLGGSQTRPFILAPVGLPLPEQPIVGAAHVHEVLAGWRRVLNHGPGKEKSSAEPATVELALPQP
jgi:Type I phosphodiesterase / nucleotide pyrophosphatase